MVFCICILLLLIRYNIDKFQNEQNAGNDNSKVGYFSIVRDNEESYDDVFGPRCLETCIREHMPNINWFNEANENLPLNWNLLAENRTKGYCHNANDTEYPFTCTSEDCRNKCDIINGLSINSNPVLLSISISFFNVNVIKLFFLILLTGLSK